jgi:hypothetical protein
MDNFGCPSDNRGEGIKGAVPAARGYIGGIPWELVRGSTGCDGDHMLAEDASRDYQTTHLQGTLMHAELLLRRGDDSLYTNIGRDASAQCASECTDAGQLLKAILFLLNNPNGSVNWANSSKPSLELAYRFYQDSSIAGQLGIGGTRLILGRSGQMVHFGTLTHGFAVGEQPTLPPTVPPPTN